MTEQTTTTIGDGKNLPTRAAHRLRSGDWINLRLKLSFQVQDVAAGQEAGADADPRSTGKVRLVVTAMRCADCGSDACRCHHELLAPLGEDRQLVLYLRRDARADYVGNLPEMQQEAQRLQAYLNRAAQAGFAQHSVEVAGVSESAVDNSQIDAEREDAPPEVKL